MLRSLHIENFRALRQFSMSGLGRVNLLVGTNNCGKTSVLEAIHLLAVPGQAAPLYRLLVRRGELRDGSNLDVDVAHVVHGHEVAEGVTFSVRGDDARGERSLSARFDADPLTDFDVRPRLVDEDGQEVELPVQRMRLQWRRGNGPITLNLPLSPGGGLSLDATRIVTKTDAEPVRFITTDGLSREAVVGLFEETVLTPEEEVVYRALRIIEPGIERLATFGARGRRTDGGGRGGIAMMLDGKRLPIGSMGDGIWRLLGVALALVRARGGILLVDEIDTGLHYSVLEKMWRLVFETAQSLDVQVFATTHSRDCYEALGAIAEPARHEISIQRIERDKAEATAFTEAGIQQVAKHDIEIR